MEVRGSETAGSPAVDPSGTALERPRREVGWSHALELLATGAPLEAVLTRIALAIEAEDPQTQCSILLLDEDQRTLRSCTAPSLPQDYVRAVDGVQIGPQVGSCGTAAFLGKVVVVEDIRTDSRWRDYREFAEPYGLLACWSAPIHSSTGRVLGTFALYFRRPRGPTDQEVRGIERAAHLAGIAIEQKRNEADLQAHREHLEELVRMRTAELQTTFENLRAADRLASIGTLAAGLAHELRNPLGLIQLEARHALQQSPTPAIVEPLEEVLAHVARCDDIIRSLLSYARLGPAHPVLSDFNDIVHAAIGLTRTHARREGIQLQLQLHHGPLQVLSKRPDLQHVVINLIENAIQAEPRSRVAILRTSQHGDRLRLEIEDDGRGMTPEQVRRAFDPLFTTRLESGGVGLGLSLSRWFVNEHEGTIEILSEFEKGTKVTVDLPLARMEQVDPEARV